MERDLKPKSIKVLLGKEEFGLRFTLNAVDEIQEHFNIPIAKLPEIMNDPINQIKNVRYVLTVLINEGIDCENDETGEKHPHVEERYVGRHIDMMNLMNMQSAALKSINNGAPKIDEENPQMAR